MAYVVNANDASTPTQDQGATQGAEELRALKVKIASVVAGAIVVGAAAATPADLTTLVQPDVNDRPAMVAGGWLPWNLNHQWGGAPMPFHLIDNATGTEYKFDAFDQYIDTDDVDFNFVGNGAAQFYGYQAFTSGKIQSLQALWLKLNRRGNPVDNFTVQLYSIAAGVPNALIATANVINGKQITSDIHGQWYRFSFAAVQVLAANTQYAIVCSKSGGADAVNYYSLMSVSVRTTKYPNNLQGVGTAVPAWTPSNAGSHLFICEAQASDQSIQSAGTFNGRIVGAEANPITRSVGYIKPLREFFPLFHPNGWSILLRGKSWTKDKTIADVMYGLHHDRINIRSATATGFTTATLYKQDGTVVTLVGISDISGASYKDILIVGRSLGDGGDYLKIYTGFNNVWTKEAESLAQTFVFDPLMHLQGHMWIMGGFPLFSSASYTKLSDMTVLPSADTWTFTTTTATVEGNVFAVSGGKLSQMKAGMAAGGDGYYAKAAACGANVTGTSVMAKLRVVSDSNNKATAAACFLCRDGTRQFNFKFHEYYATLGQSGGDFAGIPQIDMRTADAVVMYSIKGNDVFGFVNGKFIFDGAGLDLNADATNEISFGDRDTAANENTDVLWDYVGYYNTAALYPQFTSGELHEFGVWAGDKNLLGATLYNLGVPYSIKQYCGIGRNFVNQVDALSRVIGITSGFSTASTNNPPSILISEMELYTLGSKLSVEFKISANNDTNAQWVQTSTFIDGWHFGKVGQCGAAGNSSDKGGTALAMTAAGFYASMSERIENNFPFGLHKVDTRMGVSGGTGGAVGARRSLEIRSGV